MDYWKEFDEGWKGGMPVRLLEEEQQRRKDCRSWRPSNSVQSKAFSRRNKVYCSVLALSQEKKVPPNHAAQWMDAKRVQLGLTLSTFTELLPKNSSWVDELKCMTVVDLDKMINK
jgi:hypothetical protein